jgi:integrase
MRSRKPLLPFVHAYRDRHGHTRHYFRRRGFRKIPLPGALGSEEFMAAYSAALANTDRVPVGAGRTKVGSLDAAIKGYLASGAFMNLAPSSQRVRRDVLEGLAGEHGQLPVAGIARRHIVKLLDAKAGKPGAAINLLSALRVVLRYSVEVGLRADDPTIGVRGPKLREGGFYPWTEDDIARFEAHHPIGTKARLALALLLYTAQRRSDVIRFGRQHVRDGCVHLRQAKTGKALAIPIHPELQAVIDAARGDNLTFLVSEAGGPFSSDGFYAWFRRCCRQAGVTAAATPHGLRKAACRRLAEAGCSAAVIASISGHKSLREVQRYIDSADQAKLARLGIEAISRTPVATLPEAEWLPERKAE